MIPIIWDMQYYAELATAIRQGKNNIETIVKDVLTTSISILELAVKQANGNSPNGEL